MTRTGWFVTDLKAKSSGVRTAVIEIYSLALWLIMITKRTMTIVLGEIGGDTE